MAGDALCLPQDLMESLSECSRLMKETWKLRQKDTTRDVKLCEKV